MITWQKTIHNKIRQWHQDNVVGTTTMRRAGRSAVWIPAGTRDFSFLQNIVIALGAHLIQWVSATEHEAVQSPPSSTDVKIEWSYNSALPICLFGVDRHKFISAGVRRNGGKSQNPKWNQCSGGESSRVPSEYKSELNRLSRLARNILNLSISCHSCIQSPCITVNSACGVRGFRPPLLQASALMSVTK
jgi:hypothetical protein